MRRLGSSKLPYQTFVISTERHAYLATWSFTGLTVGKEYQVLVTWKADAANATNALFEVWDGAVKENSTRVNQQLAPADWQDIGDNNTL